MAGRDKGARGATAYVMVGPQGVFYIGLHEDEASVWEVALGWPPKEEIEEKKRAGWYVTEATLSWTKPK